MESLFKKLRWIKYKLLFSGDYHALNLCGYIMYNFGCEIHYNFYFKLLWDDTNKMLIKKGKHYSTFSTLVLRLKTGYFSL